MSNTDWAVYKTDVTSPVLPTAVTEIMASPCSVIATSTSRHAETEEGFYRALLHSHNPAASPPQKIKHFSSNLSGARGESTHKLGVLGLENSWTNLVKFTCAGSENLARKVDNSSFNAEEDEMGKRRHSRDTSDDFGGKNDFSSEAVIRTDKLQLPEEPGLRVPKSPGNQLLPPESPEGSSQAELPLSSTASSFDKHSDFSTQKPVRHEQQSSPTSELPGKSPVQERLSSPVQEHHHHHHQQQQGPSVQDTQPTPSSREQQQRRQQQPSTSQAQRNSPTPQEQLNIPATHQKQSSPTPQEQLNSRATEQKQSSPTPQQEKLQSSPTRHHECPSTQGRPRSPTNSADRMSTRPQDGPPAKEGDAKSRYSRLLAENRWLKRRQLCRLCKRKAANITLLPCGHLLYCETCAQTLSHCGVCRRQILADVKTFLC